MEETVEIYDQYYDKYKDRNYTYDDEYYAEMEDRLYETNCE